MTIDRRHFLYSSLGAIAGVALRTSALDAQGTQGTLPTMTVYKSPSCGCCTLWVDHATANGFTVRVVNTEDLGTVKREMGIPPRLASCHTVMVGGFVVEGHVPAGDIKRLLRDKPKVRGIAVPGMPVGSPGMEQGPPSGYDRYDVVSFTADGTISVFASHGPPTRR